MSPTGHDPDDVSAAPRNTQPVALRCVGRRSLIALGVENRPELAPRVGSFGKAVLSFFGVDREVVHLEDRFGSRAGERVVSDALGPRPVVETLVVVVEFQSSSAPSTPVGGVAITDSTCDGTSTGVNGAPDGGCSA